MNMAYRSWLWSMIVLALTLSFGIVMFAGLESPLRPLLALAFLSLCPGMAFIRLLRLDDPIAEVTLAVALSVALDTLVAGSMVYAGTWSAEVILGVLITLSLIGLALQVVVNRSDYGDMLHRRLLASRYRAYTFLVVTVLLFGVGSSIVSVWISRGRAGTPAVGGSDATPGLAVESQATPVAGIAPSTVLPPTRLPTVEPTSGATAQPKPSPTTPPTVGPTSGATAQPEPFLKTQLRFGRSLRTGNRGEDVAALQQRLRELNYFSYRENTGFFGAITREAVTQFQARNALKVSRMADEVTIHALNRCTAVCVRK
jgi:hypothetical protein